MALEVRIAKNILDYDDKFIKNMSVRETVAAAISVIVGGATFYFSSVVLKMSTDITNYLIVFLCFPIIAFGFIKPKGYKMERYLQIMIRHKFVSQKRFYILEPIVYKKAKPKIKKEKLNEVPEYFSINKKLQRKETKHKYKQAVKEFKFAKKLAKKTKQQYNNKEVIQA